MQRCDLRHQRWRQGRGGSTSGDCSKFSRSMPMRQPPAPLLSRLSIDVRVDTGLNMRWASHLSRLFKLQMYFSSVFALSKSQTAMLSQQHLIQKNLFFFFCAAIDVSLVHPVDYKQSLKLSGINQIKAPCSNFLLVSLLRIAHNADDSAFRAGIDPFFNPQLPGKVARSNTFIHGSCLCTLRVGPELRITVFFFSLRNFSEYNLLKQRPVP